MHIRRDWQKWLVPTDSNKRITAVCGAKTSEKFAGIPGVTEQPVFYSSDGNAGWCVHCCGLALEQFNDTFESVLDKKFETSSMIKNQYVMSAAIMMKQVMASNSQT